MVCWIKVMAIKENLKWRGDKKYGKGNEIEIRG